MCGNIIECGFCFSLGEKCFDLMNGLLKFVDRKMELRLRSVLGESVHCHYGWKESEVEIPDEVLTLIKVMNFVNVRNSLKNLFVDGLP